jgi:hypothetical protein
MIVRVSARGQANSSADGYLCATQLGQAERRVQKRRSCGYQVLPGTENCLIRIHFRKICARFSVRTRRIACRPGRPGRLVGLEATAGAFTVAEVLGCHGTKTMFVSFCTLPRPVAGRSRWGYVGVRT